MGRRTFLNLLELNKSKKVLEQKYSKIAYELYCFDIMPEKEEYVLDVMFQMYKELK